MCGIAGILESSLAREDLVAQLTGAQAALRHRGPDDEGIYLSPDGRTGLAHTRLAILDLSPAGHQPMRDASGRYVITFNGEIYNFQTLRAELAAEGETFQSQSDTEVILKMYQRHGPSCVREFEGMFAFAIWDEQERTAFLARDPLGIKPLFYHERDGVLCFASEIRALLKFRQVLPRVSAPAVCDYLLFGSVQEPETMVEEVHSLPAGHYLIWKDGRFRTRPYWDVKFSSEPFTPPQAAAAVREVLLDSVQRHFVSDVPVSIFLSGGIDSTLVLALATRVRDARLRTFCISVDDPAFNEGDVAARTAAHFRTEHHDLRLDAPTGRHLLQEFLARSGQPSIDGFNTFCVSKLAHDHGAKVVLSGLGGDELFGGYPSFDRVPKLVGANRWLGLGGSLKEFGGRCVERFSRGPQYRRLGSYLAGLPSAAGAYWCVRGIFTPHEARVLAAKYAGADGWREGAIHFGVPAQPTPRDEVSYLELTRYMRNQLLRDSDKMSMAWGLELRVPYVDRKVVETVARIPAALRLAPGKRILLEAVPEIPDWVANRPKRGFLFPYEHWMTEEWHDVFRQIESESPLPLQNWYRRWSIFALENFLKKLGIS
ncbi:MAG: asparagine synthase (glutamine-hydrolyzing) [Verrucomicrobia bacterium]|nr:asparagine synthase (glutamine-hydrolyzing) [Verrucomicrobiota bacterium]